MQKCRTDRHHHHATRLVAIQTRPSPASARRRVRGKGRHSGRQKASQPRMAARPLQKGQKRPLARPRRAIGGGAGGPHGKGGPGMLRFFPFARATHRWQHPRTEPRSANPARHDWRRTALHGILEIASDTKFGQALTDWLLLPVGMAGWHCYSRCCWSPLLEM
jgi:hypothetical protein